MKREDLKTLGLTDEQIDTIMKAHGEDIEKHKSAVDTTKAELARMAEQLAEANKAIDSFKGMDVEGIKKAADEWKAKAEQAAAEAKEQVTTMRFDHALEGAMTGSKVKYSKEVLARLKLEELKDRDGNFIPERFEAQIKTVKESAGDLFESEGPQPRLVGSTNSTTTVSDATVAAARAAAGLTVSTENKK